ncbi:carbohydrate ABC transporter permease [Pseudonocardia sp. TRM90224]|uniref:carbohydrate ABC transporter permease n=1 Tax=Pseudonocardia sp. TRM90224 TaxID=2812678 RepID=UPI001E438F1C|nr:sugar ABC transporter permease [Pseudonocardia sp. TRM90224]
MPAGAVRQARKAGTTGRPLWLMAPGGLLIALVILVPAVLALWMSLLQLDQYSLRTWLSAPFVGLGNYVEAFVGSRLLHSVWVSVAFGVLTTLLTLPIGVAAALAAHNAFRGRALVRSVFLIPYVLPSFVTATIWRTLLQPSGAVNESLSWFGIDGGLWLIGDRSFWTLVLVDTWAAWPFIYLLALAGLQVIDREAHEAAALDGASWSQKLRYVVLPYLRGPLALAVIIATLSHINNFTLPYVLFGSPAPRPVEVLPMLTYTTSFQTVRFGLGSAMAILSVVLIAIPLFIYLRAVRLDTGNRAGER